MSYNSKYSGQQVESLLDQVANGNTGGGGGGITTELDPIFSASPAAKITDENISSWNNKVDKVDGKQLSTEDFTTLLKQKLDGLSNYDDTEISQAVLKLRTDLDTLVSGDTTTAIKTFNEVIAFLDGLEDTEDLASIIVSIEQQIAGKQDKLVSGTNIKTINGESILGSGDIAISGGSSSDIYVLEINYYESGVVSAEEFEKIRQCKILILSMYLGAMTIALQSKVNNEDELSFGTTISYSSAVLYSITFNLNEDGSAGWSFTNTQQYFKTINGESILGESEGDITISGGESSNARKEIVYKGGMTDCVITAMRPNVVYWLDGIKNVTIDSFEEPLQGVDSYDIFTVVMSLDSQMSNAYDVSLTLPDNILWANGQMPDLKEGAFELSISRMSDGDLSYYYAVLTHFDR